MTMWNTYLHLASSKLGKGRPLYNYVPWFWLCLALLSLLEIWFTIINNLDGDLNMLHGLEILIPSSGTGTDKWHEKQLKFWYA